jgi:signal peptidase I
MMGGVQTRWYYVRALLCRTVRGLLRAWWFVIAPGVLAALALELVLPALTPLNASSPQQASLLFSPATVGAAIFVLYAGLAYYWRYHLPGRRALSGLPADVAIHCRAADELRRFASAAALLAIFRRHAVRRRCERTLSPAVLADLTRHLEALGGALAAHSDTALEHELAGVETLAAPVLRAKRWRDAAGTLLVIALTAGGVVGLRAVAFDTYGVQSTSMLPTLEPGDVVLGSRLGRDGRMGVQATLRRGDIVVFRSKAIKTTWPAGTPDLLIKRVIGLPGDQIEVFADNAFINNWLVPSCDAGTYTYLPPGGDGALFQGRLKLEFLEGRTYMSLRPAVVRQSSPYAVQPGEVYVLGDNRQNSYDSRAWGGGVPMAAIEARGVAFGVGTHRDGSTDFTRLLRPIDGAGLHVEGLDARELSEQLEGCRHVRQRGDRPPHAGASSPAPQ